MEFNLNFLLPYNYANKAEEPLRHFNWRHIIIRSILFHFKAYFCTITEFRHKVHNSKINKMHRHLLICHSYQSVLWSTTTTSIRGMSPFVTHGTVNLFFSNLILFSFKLQFAASFSDSSICGGCCALEQFAPQFMFNNESHVYLAVRIVFFIFVLLMLLPLLWYILFLFDTNVFKSDSLQPGGYAIRGERRQTADERRIIN